MNNMKGSIFGLVFFINIVFGQQILRICTTSQFENQCSQLQRGDSEVECQRVQDSIECAQRIRNQTADFGVFSAENTLHLAHLAWQDLTVINELRHRDRQNQAIDFQSVVVVRANHENGINGLRGLKFCHPGLFYDRTQRWTERFLKHFERTVVPVDCNNADIKSPAEIEAAALASFFQSACRPGLWSNNLQEDAQLKSKYPQLCDLCNNESSNCSYPLGTGSYHQSALNCLRTGGDVAYVSLEDARNFFVRDNSELAASYAYLCPNGTKQTILNNTQPCAWLSQPWKLIISSNERAVELSNRVPMWMNSNGNWQTALREIIYADSYIISDATIQHPVDYFRPYREVPIGSSLCSTQVIWCTSSFEEKDKCDVVRSGGITTGIYPVIECSDPQSNVVGCLSDINSSRADFTGIDSNFGYIARHAFNLQSAMYAETENARYSSVVVLVHRNSTYERFENLRNARACFPEFGGIASMAFINTGKNRGFFNKGECNYGHLLNDFFGSTCAPGAKDKVHDINSTNPDGLCTLCRMKSASAPTTFAPRSGSEFSDVDDRITRNVDDAKKCAADSTNRFYGTEGALLCLHEEGDVAILELQYLTQHAKTLDLNPNDFRIMCRNGSLADRTGFNVDQDCALTTIIDGEVVVRLNSEKIPSIINALNSLDRYFQNDPDFKMYNIFSGHTDLLFKDSTIGLVPYNEPKLGSSVENYKLLFRNLENCVQGNSAIISAPSVFLLFISFIYIFCRINV